MLQDGSVKAASLYMTLLGRCQKEELYQKPLMPLIKLELSQSSEVAFFQRDAFDRVRLLDQLSLSLCY
jgi:hypothetical protein